MGAAKASSRLGNPDRRAKHRSAVLFSQALTRLLLEKPFLCLVQVAAQVTTIINKAPRGNPSSVEHRKSFVSESSFHSETEQHAYPQSSRLAEGLRDVDPIVFGERIVEGVNGVEVAELISFRLPHLAAFDHLEDDATEVVG